MKFLITGGAGFIGHNVVRFLEHQGHSCTVIDTSTDYGFIPEQEISFLFHNRSNRIKSPINLIDIRDANALDSLFKTSDFDVVIHMASFPRQKVVSENPILGSDVMVTGLINLLELSKKYSVRKFVYTSSSMVYGDFSNGTDELVPCNPIGQYGIMKYMGEKLVADYSRRSNLNHVIVRPSAVYGEWDVEDRVISKFMISACRGETLKVKGADEVLDFTYVEDTAQGIGLAALSDRANNNVYNITRSSEHGYTLKEAAELIVELAGRGTIEIQDKDLAFPSRGLLDITRARNDFGYNPTIDVEEGFRRYYAWYQQYPHLWK